MALIDYKQPRLNVYSKNNSHYNITGGWRVLSNNTPNFKYQIPFESKEYFDNSLFITDRSIGCAVLLLTSDDSQGVTSASIITNKMIDFSKHNSLNLIFNRDNDFIASKVFKRELTIEIIDKYNQSAVVWDCGGKTCWFERGKLDVSNIDSGYIKIGFNMSRAFDLYSLLDKNLNQLYTINNEKIILKSYNKPSPSDPDYTSGNMLLEIMDMWLE